MKAKLTKTVVIMICTALLMVSVIALTFTRVLAVQSVEQVVDYDAPFLPEGIAMDKQGNLFISLATQSEIRKIAVDGTETTLTTLPTGGFGLLGLAVDAPGNVYAAVATADGVTNGVYKIDKEGNSERLPGSEAIFVPNAMVFDKQGNMFVTDTVLGAVWRIQKNGAVEQWIQDESLEGNEDFGFGVPLGANGIAYRQGMLYVANSEKGQIVQIPVNRDGSSGAPAVLISRPELVGADGLALDVHGNIFATSSVHNTLMRIDIADLTLTIEASEGLDFPASLLFGTGKGERKSIFITNFAFLSGENPGVVKIDAGVAGWPLP